MMLVPSGVALAYHWPSTCIMQSRFKESFQMNIQMHIILIYQSCMFVNLYSHVILLNDCTLSYTAQGITISFESDTSQVSQIALGILKEVLCYFIYFYKTFSNLTECALSARSPRHASLPLPRASEESACGSGESRARMRTGVGAQTRVHHRVDNGRVSSAL